jgi:hypothetical protein
VAFLTPAELVGVRDAADEADLGDAELRPLLFEGVLRQYVRSLPVLAAPLRQLHSDLSRLNQVERLVDGSVPLELWLANATRLALVAEPRATLQAALEQVASAASGEPEPPPAELGELPEAIVHADDTVAYDFLRLGWEAGEAVVRLVVPPFLGGRRRLRDGAEAPPHLGTGWLVSAELLMTNHHVVAARGRDELTALDDADLRLQGAHASAEFGFDDDAGAEVTVAPMRELVAWDAELDYAVLRLARPAGRAPLRLAAEPLTLLDGDRAAVNIIQHPLGGSKRVALRNNLLDRVTQHDLRYFTDTRGGSSGAPVLDDRWRVVGLHRASRRVPEIRFQGKETAVVNVGSPIHAILDDLAARHPGVRAEIGPP